MACHPVSVAYRRYNRRIIWASLAYSATLLGSMYSLKHHLIDGPVLWAIAALPALSIIGLFAALGRYLVEEQDEYLRMQMVKQALWASGFALSWATLWGFFHAFGLVDQFDVNWISVVWFFGLGFGAIANEVARRRAA